MPEAIDVHDHWHPCLACAGSGLVLADHMEVVCPHCSGKGGCLDDDSLEIEIGDPVLDAAEWDTPASTYALTDHVFAALGELLSLPERQVVADIISEALFGVALAVRRGETVDIEYIGQLSTLGHDTDCSVRFVADRSLFIPFTPGGK